MRRSTSIVASALAPSLLLVGGEVPSATGSAAQARVGAVKASSCTLSARRILGQGRQVLGRAPISGGVARWRVSTTGWSPGAWRLRAACRSLVVPRDVKVVAQPGPPPVSDHFTTPTVTTVPALSPAYSPAIADYVLPCTPGVPVTVDVDTAVATYASVDGGRWRSWSVTREVALQPGQRFLLKVAGGSRVETASIRCLPTDLPTLSAGTATVQEVVRDPAVAHAGFAGSARRLRHGGWLVAWGATNRISAYDQSGSPQPTISGMLPNGDKGMTYRAVPIAVEDRPGTTLRRGMDEMYPRG